METDNNDSAMPYVKGQSGNPGGRPRENDEVKAVRNLAKDELVRSLSACLLMDAAGLDRIEASAQSTNAMRVVSSLVRKAVKLGCPMDCS